MSQFLSLLPILDALCANIAAYRRWRGGHWELWPVDEDERAGDPWGVYPEWFRVSTHGRRPRHAVGDAPLQCDPAHGMHAERG